MYAAASGAAVVCELMLTESRVVCVCPLVLVCARTLLLQFCGALKVIAALKGMSHESYLAAEVADRDPEAALARFSSKSGGATIPGRE